MLSRTALSMAAMGWEILWPLILGFFLSAVVQAIVSHREMSRLLPDDGPRSILVARYTCGSRRGNRRSMQHSISRGSVLRSPPCAPRWTGRMDR
jgi:hypothetical protein